MILLTFILKNKKTFESKKFQDYLGYGSNMFHLKSGLLKYIVDQGNPMIEQREQLINVLIKIDKFRNPKDPKNSEYRVKEMLKLGLDTSEGLAEILASVEERYSWSAGKMWTKRFLCILSLLVTVSIHVFDVKTDFVFSFDMLFTKSEINFTKIKQQMIK